MKVIIAGGRNFDDMAALVQVIKNSGFDITEVVSGTAPDTKKSKRGEKEVGADILGVYWARANGIAERIFPAHWTEWGRSAGPRRNRQMAAYADALIALPGGSGTDNMVREAYKRGLKVHDAR